MNVKQKQQIIRGGIFDIFTSIRLNITASPKRS